MLRNTKERKLEELQKDKRKRPFSTQVIFRVKLQQYFVGCQSPLFERTYELGKVKYIFTVEIRLVKFSCLWQFFRRRRYQGLNSYREVSR